MRKMNRTTSAILAVVFGLATVLLFRWGLQQRDAAEPAQAAQSVRVVVARDAIAPRSILKPEMLQVREMTETDVPETAVRDIARTVGMATTRRIGPGEPLLEEDLSQKSAVLGLAYDIPSGMRAASVSLDPVSGVSGFLKPGDHVDVLATYTGQQDVTVTKTVLQDVMLLAIGSQPASTANYRGTGDSAPLSGRERATEAQPEAPTATLAVFPDQAQLLVMAQSKAKIQLVLRPPDDQAVRPISMVTSGRVFGVPDRPVVTETAPPAPRQVVVTPPVPAPQPLMPMPVEPREPVETPAKPAEQPIVVIRGSEQTTVSVP